MWFKTISIALASILLGSSFMLLADDEPTPRPLTNQEINTAKDLGMTDIMYVSNPMTKEARQGTDRDTVKAMQQLDTYSQQSDRAVGRMISFAAFLLDRKGYTNDAIRLRGEYTTHYTHAVYYHYLGVQQVDLGDHKPLSQWLADWYDALDALLGPTVMEMTHLVDIKILNFAIPVVFHPKGYLGDSWDMKEYRNHFVPFSGAVSYWITWSVCVGATWGAGAITFLCGPIAEVSKYIVVKRIAPTLSDKIYTHYTN